MLSDNLELTRLNAEKSFALATALFPLEEWIPRGKGVFIAKSRLSGGHKEQAKLFREVASIRSLAGLGSVVYFLPERFEGKSKGKRRADTVMDGAIVELKTVSGNRTTLGKSFKRGYKQGLSMLETNPEIKAEHDVFLRLYTPFTVESVRAKIAGEIKNTSDRGRCICYFEATEELFYWTYDELRAIVGA
jgi:hypothetical protein